MTGQAMPSGDGSGTLATYGDVRYGRTPLWMFEALRDKRISPSALALYGWVMLRYVGLPDGIFPNHKTLAGELGVSDRTVRTLLAQLRSIGAMDWRQQHRENSSGMTSNRYVIAWLGPGQFGPDWPAGGRKLPGGPRKKTSAPPRKKTSDHETDRTSSHTEEKKDPVAGDSVVSPARPPGDDDPPEDRPSRSAQPQPRPRPAPPPEPLPDIPPATCPRHAGGNPGDEPCRACRDARAAHDRARAARADILAKRDHAAVHAAMNDAARTAVRLPKGFLREHMTRPGDARGDPVATP